MALEASKREDEGTVTSGDVALFYRRFGTPSATPVLILHGSSYYDSADWVGVARALAYDREVVAYDARGYGRSSWSAIKDYSHEANIGDIETLLDHLGWRSAVLLGHSRGGAYATLFAARKPGRAAGLVLVDYAPGIGVRGGGGAVMDKQTIGAAPRVFPTIEAAFDGMSRHPDVPPGSPARARLAEILKPVPGGYIIAPRDPDYLNPIPLSPAGWTPTIPFAFDMWQELATLNLPILAFRGLRSPAFTPEVLARMQRDFPRVRIVDIDAGHDVVAVASETLISVTRAFLSEHFGAAH